MDRDGNNRLKLRNIPKIKVISPRPRRVQDDSDYLLPNHTSSTTFLASFLKLFSKFLTVPFNIVIQSDEELPPEVHFILKGKLSRLIYHLIHLAQQIFLFYLIKDTLDKLLIRVEAWSVIALLTHIFYMILHILVWYVLRFRYKDLQRLLSRLEEKHRNDWVPIEYQHWTLKLCQGPDAVMTWAFISLIITGLLHSFRRRLAWSIIPSYLVSQNSKFFNWIMIPIYGIIFFVDRLGCVVELFVLAGALSMFEVVKQYEEQVSNTKTPLQLMEAHRDIRKELDQFNGIFGKLFISHYICTLLTYVGTPAMLAKMSVGLDRIAYRVVYIGVHAIIYLSACQVNSLVKTSVLEWVYECKLRLGIQSTDLIKLNILATEVENQPTGISCGSFFVISYRLMGSFFGVLATYAIFAWQMQAHDGTV